MIKRDPVYSLDELSRSNWHIHTTFSACASPEMTVSNIIAAAASAGLRTIALVDHHHGPEQNILEASSLLKEEVRQHGNGVEVLVGAELSAWGKGKYSDPPAVNSQLEFRAYACNHYHIGHWEHPEDRSPRGYAEHMLALLRELLPSGRADMIAHPLSARYLLRQLKDITEVTRSITDNELGEILSLGAKHNVAWEINTKLLSKDPAFLKRYWHSGREVGATFLLGTDAHNLVDVDPRPFVEPLRSLLT